MRSDVCRLFPAVVLLAAISAGAWPPELPFAVEGGREELVRELRQLLTLVERGDENAIRALAEGMDTEDGMLGRGIVITLAEELAEEGAATVPALLAELPSAEPSVRAGLVRALGSIKASGDLAAVPLMQRLLEDQNSKVRMEAAFALGNLARGKTLREPSAVQALTRALRDPDAQVRETAAWALAEMGPDAASAIPELQRLLSEKDRKVRLQAAASLGLIGEAAAGAVPALLHRLKVEPADDDIRQVILVALSRIGPAASEATPTLIEIVRTDDFFAGHAALALGHVGVESAAAVETLLATLGHENFLRRGDAAAALGSLGVASESVIAALRKAAELDPKRSVREKATEALQKLEAGAAP
jgi:HEAT repeat protein